MAALVTESRRKIEGATPPPVIRPALLRGLTTVNGAPARRPPELSIDRMNGTNVEYTLQNVRMIVASAAQFNPAEVAWRRRSAQSSPHPICAAPKGVLDA